MPDTLDSATAYKSFTELGLDKDSVTLEEFSRLYDGPLGDALLFISQHVKGRAVVIEARKQILSSTELRSKSRIKQPGFDATKRSAGEIASSRLAKAKKDMEVFSAELEAKLKVVDATQAKINSQKSELQAKRRVDLMLELLERKERERIKRFEELGSMLAELKQKIQSPSPEIHFPPPQDTDPTSKRALLDPSNTPSQTRDALANLEAYHVRISRLAARNQTSQLTRDAEFKLKTVVAQKLGVNEDDPEVNRVFQTFVRVARNRAQDHTSYKSTLDGTVQISSEELARLSSDVKKKQVNLQQTSDLSVALAGASERLLQSIDTFQTTTKSSVHQSLTAKLTAIQGYVDTLRAHIITEFSSPTVANLGSEAQFDREVRKVLGLSDAATSEKVIEEVQRLIRNNHSKAQFLRSATIPPLPERTEDEVKILADFHASTQAAEEKSVKLLTRKVAKAEMARGLMNDVGALLKEAEVIVGHGNGSKSRR